MTIPAFTSSLPMPEPHRECLGPAQLVLQPPAIAGPDGAPSHPQDRPGGARTLPAQQIAAGGGDAGVAFAPRMAVCHTPSAAVWRILATPGAGCPDLVPYRSVRGLEN